MSAVVSLAAPVAFVVAYQSWSPSPTVAAARAPAQRTVAATITPAKVRLRPCEAGTRLQHGVCVAHRVRTVVVPVVPAPPSTPPSPAAAPASDDGPGFQGDDADEPPATPSTSDNDDGDEDESQPGCAVQHDSDQPDATDSRCDDDAADEQGPPETEGAGEADDVEHEDDGGNGVGTGTDD